MNKQYPFPIRQRILINLLCGFLWLISLEDYRATQHYFQMHSVFRLYPAHPWLADWTFKPRDITACRKTNGGHFFHTLGTVGHLCPSVDSPEWTVQLPIPQNCRINLLFNGFCGYYEGRRENFSIECIVPEPGVLWGRFHNIPDPVLLSDEPVLNNEGVLWLESDRVPALLIVRDSTFCLVTKAHIYSEAVDLAVSFLEQDFEVFMRRELDCRAGASNLFEQMDHHDALSVVSVECLQRALRPAEGNISGPWSQSPAEKTPHLNTNELYGLALAWRHLDINVAEELIRTVLKVQTSSGAIPVRYAPQETYSILEAPKPLIAKAAEEVWKVRKDAGFADEIIQPLRRYLQWLLHHFDPKRRGLHAWQNSSEPLTPEIYDRDLATVDLTVLLLTEIDALNRLQQAAPEYADQPLFFAKERENLEHNLQHQFWNDTESQFCNAILRGRLTIVKGFPAFLPLLWKKLPITQQNRLIDPVRESGNIPGGLSLLSWRKSALDDQSFPLLHQLLVLEILKQADPLGTLVNGFARLIMQGFIEWHTQSVEEYGTLRLDSATAAFIINLQETQHGRKESGGMLSKMVQTAFRKTRTDWFDVVVIAASILAIAMVHMVYRQCHRPPPLIALRAEMNSAYASKDIEVTLAAGNAIIKHYPEEAVMAKLMTGNALLIRHRYEEASDRLADVREVYPDSPGPMIALGLAYQLQGRFDEAEKNYEEFSYLFGDIFPEIVSIIQRNRQLMYEGFRSPPNWTEIYRYQLMHEL